MPLSKSGSFDKIVFAGSLQPFRCMAGAQLAIKLRHFFLLKNTAKKILRKKLAENTSSSQPAPPVLQSTKLKQPKVWSRSRQPPFEGAPAYERPPYPPVVAAPSQAVLDFKLNPTEENSDLSSRVRWTLGRFAKHRKAKKH